MVILSVHIRVSYRYEAIELGSYIIEHKINILPMVLTFGCSLAGLRGRGQPSLASKRYRFCQRSSHSFPRPGKGANRDIPKIF